jgi:uncharacterized pyridoxamine 5'-phosphate oxidase family protein
MAPQLHIIRKNEENKYKKIKKNNYATICWVKKQTKN